MGITYPYIQIICCCECIRPDSCSCIDWKIEFVSLTLDGMCGFWGEKCKIYPLD